MSDVKLGATPPENAERDAIHVAVVPMVAGQTLQPGQRVELFTRKTALATRGVGVGIVDPFRDCAVMCGETFWLLLHPNTVTGMRHHWSHSSFSDSGVSGEKGVECGASADATADATEAESSEKEGSASIEPIGTREEHEAWLRKYAENLNCYSDPNSAFEQMIKDLQRGRLHARGSDLHGLYELDDADELRFHAEQYLGMRINWEQFSFSCSC
jgi:hypothetical protein